MAKKSSKPKVLSIMFVCTGNTCRSPMAQVIFENYVKRQSTETIVVASSGISAMYGSPMARNSQIALKKIANDDPEYIIPYDFESTVYKKKFLKDYDLIVCMTPSHKSALGESEHIIHFGELPGCMPVPDPYGGPLEEYIGVAEYISRNCGYILEKLMSMKKS